MSRLDAFLSDDDRPALHEEPFPEWKPPMLATLVDEPFSDPDWLFERKLDGVRLLAFASGDGVRLLTRNRKRRDSAYPEIGDAIAAAGPPPCILDGEVVAFDGDVTSFARLQGRMKLEDPDRARATGIAIEYYAFDLLHLGGFDLAGLPLRRRKAILKRILPWRDPLRFTPHRNERGESFLEEACAKGWEGVIAKRASSRYAHARSRDWLKFKCVRGQEFVIGGFTDPEGERIGFGALLIGYHDDAGDLRYAGKVGTGYDEETLESLASTLMSIERKTPPFDATGALPRKGVHWVTPKLVCEVGFTEWTGGGRLRHPRFKGLRDDKAPDEVVREAPAG